MDATWHSFRCAKPHCTNHSTDRYTASQLVWKARAVSRQLSRRAQRAKNPIMVQVTGRLPSLHECARLLPRARHTPLVVARSKNGLGFPTAAQIASAAGASDHSPALVADNANSARVSRHG